MTDITEARINELKEAAEKYFHEGYYSDAFVQRMADGIGWESSLVRKVLPWLLSEQSELHDALLAENAKLREALKAEENHAMRRAKYELLFQRIEDGAWRNQWPKIATAMAEYKTYFVQLALLQDLVGITKLYETLAALGDKSDVR